MDDYLDKEEYKSLAEYFDGDTLASGEEEHFAARVTSISDEAFDAFKPLRDKCTTNEDYYRNQFWNEKPTNEAGEPKPNVPAIHSMIENCVADCQDAMPDAIMRGVNGDDDLKSTILTEGVRFTMQRANYADVHEKHVRACYKKGASVRHTFFNPELANGLGDIDYAYRDIRNFFWDPNVADINDGQFCGYFEWMPENTFRELYPGVDIDDLIADDENKRDENVNENEGVTDRRQEGLRIVNYYWKEYEQRETESRRTFISYAKVIGKHVLEVKRKMYEYNRFMFVMTPFIPLDNFPIGLGLIDIFRDEADTINRIQQMFVKNLQESARKRWFVSDNADVNEDELLDYNKLVVHAGEIHQNALMENATTPFSASVLNYQNAMMGRMKEWSGQLDVNIGQSSAGVTAASAINSLQEYGAKRSRLFIQRDYRDFRQIVRDTIFLQKEHYTTERFIRISPTARATVEAYIQAAAQMREQGETAPDLPVNIADGRVTVNFAMLDLDNFDIDYDIQIVPQKKSPATSNLLNSLVQQLANAGAFNGAPDLLVELLEVEGKEPVARKIRERMGAQKQIEAAQQQLEALSEQNQQITKAYKSLQSDYDSLEKKYWQERINEIRQLITSKQAEGEEQPQSPDNAEDAIAELEREMGLSA